MFASGETLHAPYVIDLEVAQALRRYVRSGAISSDRGAEALADLTEFPLTRHEHTVLLKRVWHMRDTLTAYDAAYLALAEALHASLVTRDHAFAAARSTVKVELV